MTNIGIELEYPVAESGDYETKMSRTASKSRELHNMAEHDSFRDGRVTYDGTVGCEIVSDVLDVEDGSNWYYETIDTVESRYGYDFGPTSLLQGGSTAGLHLHLSPLSTDEAYALYEMSKEPWMQVFACSAVTDDRAPEYPVFRDNYCQLTFDEGRYSVVNSRGGGHWEWRLPEPVTPEHFSKMQRFLEIFTEGDIDGAKAFVRDEVDRGDGITSVERADVIGATWEEEEDSHVTREAHPETESWFRAARNDESAPYIYLVQMGDEDYYGFHSHRPHPVTVEGVEFNRGTVLYADTLDRVHDYGTVQDVRDAVQEERGGRRGPTPTSNPETKNLLKEIVEKKKK